MEQSKSAEVKIGRLVASCWSGVIDALILENTNLLSLPNLTVDTEKGVVVKANLSFIPCISGRLSIEDLACRGVGNEESVEGEWTLKDSQIKIRTFTTRLGEEEIIFVDRLPESENSESSLEEKTVKYLIEVLETAKDKISCNYAKYFVSNSLIVAEEKLASAELTTKIRTTLYTFINEHIKKKQEQKSMVQEYMDNFSLRPFYGPTIMKLPTFKAEFDRYDWDDLYMNVEQTKKELNIA
jgi:hypothetical protein